MAKLVVRQMGIRDLVRLHNVRQRHVDAFHPDGSDHPGSDFRQHLKAGLPLNKGSTAGFVAHVDDELCGYLIVEREDENFTWQVVTMAAGSERVDATDDVTTELWTSLIEFVIKEAGREGMRRLTAVPPEQSLAQEVLERTGFVPYSRTCILRGTLTGRNGRRRLREQHESDIWSIHQIYNRSTPRAVQFAEARTSDWWRSDSGGRLPGSHGREVGFVLDAADGIDFYCRIVRRRRPIVSFMVTDGCDTTIVPLVRESVERAGESNREIEIDVPAYQQEHIAGFLDTGFWIHSERVAMVRHTTVHHVVHPNFGRRAGKVAPVSSTSGVPTLMRSRYRS